MMSVSHLANSRAPAAPARALASGAAEHVPASDDEEQPRHSTIAFAPRCLLLVQLINLARARRDIRIAGDARVRSEIADWSFASLSERLVRVAELGVANRPIIRGKDCVVMLRERGVRFADDACPRLGVRLRRAVTTARRRGVSFAARERVDRVRAAAGGLCLVDRQADRIS